MARPVTITDEQILEAAREVFLEAGFQASTAEIARRAGVSEGSLFNRFTTKVELFFASIGIPLTAPWHETADRLSGKGDFKENLIRLYEEICEHEVQILPRIMMLWASKAAPKQSPMEMVRSFAKKSNTGAAMPPPIRDLMKLKEFFTREIELGRMRRCDPHMAAMAFDGVIRQAAMFEMMGLEGPKKSRKAAREMVECLWPTFKPEND